MNEEIMSLMTFMRVMHSKVETAVKFHQEAGKIFDAIEATGNIPEDLRELQASYRVYGKYLRLLNACPMEEYLGMVQASPLEVDASRFTIDPAGNVVYLLSDHQKYNLDVIAKRIVRDPKFKMTISFGEPLATETAMKYIRQRVEEIKNELNN